VNTCSAAGPFRVLCPFCSGHGTHTGAQQQQKQQQLQQQQLQGHVWQHLLRRSHLTAAVQADADGCHADRASASVNQHAVARLQPAAHD
jgi:hypothetical protein